MTTYRDTVYYSRRLTDQLALIARHSLTIVEAPSGFGKTTAVRGWLRENLSASAREYWYTCLGETAESSWRAICALIEQIDRETAVKMRRLDFPTVDTLPDTVACLRSISCDEETYVVIDNFQLIESAIHRRTIAALALHNNPNLHFIIITQQMEVDQTLRSFHSGAHVIGTDKLFFTEEDIAAWFRQSGIRLGDEDAQRLYQMTEGWVSALRLQMTQFLETGSFEYARDFDKLVESAFWSRLSAAEREFMLAVSVLDSFSLRQAGILMNVRELPPRLERLLDTNPFVRYYPDKSAYSIHNVLLGFLRGLFRRQPEEFRNLMLRRAGDACRDAGEFILAAQHYHQTGDFESILAMQLHTLGLSDYKGDRLEELLQWLIDDCPPPLLRRYPMTLLAMAFEFFSMASYAEFEKSIALLTELLEDPDALAPAERRRVQGEMALVLSFTEYNDIEKMSEGHKAAYDLLGGPAQFITLTDAWTYGGSSVVAMFWRRSGGLENAVACLEKCLPYYCELTRGHGTGADCAMRAEALLLQGKIDAAEALCHKTMYLASSKYQESLYLCAGLTLARIALLRGDADAYQGALESMKNLVQSGNERASARILELIRGFLGACMGEPGEIAPWLSDMAEIERLLFAPVVPQGHIIFGKKLLLEKQYNALCGVAGPALAMAEALNCVLPCVYFLVYLALARRALGRDDAARDALRRALEAALPDGVLLPFAENITGLEDMLEAEKSVFGGASINDVLALGRRCKRGAGAVKRALSPAGSALTHREREIALLARDGLTTREIADRLYISSETVKSTMKNIFLKLDIRSKVQLGAIKLQ